jgi:hypothetical protein
MWRLRFAPLKKQVSKLMLNKNSEYLTISVYLENLHIFIIYEDIDCNNCEFWMEGTKMTYFRIFNENEVTDASGIGITLLVLFIIIFIGTSLFLVKKYNSVLPTLKIAIGILIYLVISVVSSDVLVRIIVFPQGEYYNYGLGGGLFRLLFSILIGLLIGFLVTRLIYFKSVN